MQIRKFLLIALAVTILVGGGSYAAPANACGWFTTCSNQGATDQQRNEQSKVNANQSRLENEVPVPTLENSLERQNISKRLKTFNDPNKVSYIYLVSYGKVMSFYTVKGKITSGTKRLTSTQRQIEAGSCGSGNCDMVMESPELDGTYGSSASYIFFWTTDGAYIQWSGDYMLADQPLQLATTPEITRQITQ